MSFRKRRSTCSRKFFPMSSIHAELIAPTQTRAYGLIACGAPLVLVIGCRDRSRQLLISQLAKACETAYVDAETCGSSSGVMSSVIHRVTSVRNSLSRSNSPSIRGSTSRFVKASEKSEYSIIKDETSTPDSEDALDSRLLASNSVSARPSAQAALLKLRAKPTKGRKRVEMFDDDLMDADSDYSSDSSSSSEDCDLTSSSKRVSNSHVSLDVLRTLYRAQNMTARNSSSFIQKLERILVSKQSALDRLVIVIDNVDSILSSEEYDLDPSSSKSDTTDLLRILSKLNEYIPSVSVHISVVLVSSRPLPVDISAAGAIVSIPSLTMAQVKERIAHEYPQLESWFINNTVALLYPVFSSNSELLVETVVRIRNDPQLEKVNPSALPAKTKLVCTQEIRRLFGGGDDFDRISDQEKDLKLLKLATKWLSKMEKEVLLAGYLAAHNPASQDKILFRVVGQQAAPAGRKKVASTNAFKRGKLNADSINVRAPSPFNLDRLFSIFRYLSGSWEDEIDSGVAFQRSVRALVQHGLFKSTASEDWLRSGIKLNCHAPHDLIELLARDINVKLDEVLYA